MIPNHPNPLFASRYPGFAVFLTAEHHLTCRNSTTETVNLMSHESDVNTLAGKIHEFTDSLWLKVRVVRIRLQHTRFWRLGEMETGLARDGKRSDGLLLAWLLQINRISPITRFSDFGQKKQSKKYLQPALKSEIALRCSALSP
jgi:hypothetical protein